MISHRQGKTILGVLFLDENEKFDKSDYFVLSSAHDYVNDSEISCSEIGNSAFVQF